MVEEPISLSFVFRPRSNISTYKDKSAAYSGATLRHMHSQYLPNSNSFIYAFICEATHSLAVFGMTQPWVD